jgi:hypothetical protein
MVVHGYVAREADRFPVLTLLARGEGRKLLVWEPDRQTATAAQHVACRLIGLICAKRGSNMRF